MDSGSIGIGSTLNSGNNLPLKKLHCISEEYVAYVSLKIEARVIDERLVGIYFDQEEITKGAVNLIVSQGELTLERSKNMLCINFDLKKNGSGYEFASEWAIFKTNDSSKSYINHKNKSFLIPLGSSTIKDLTIDYSLYLENSEKQGISITILEANIHVLRSTDNKDQSLKEELDEIFNDPNTINIDLVYEKQSR